MINPTRIICQSKFVKLFLQLFNFVVFKLKSCLINGRDVTPHSIPDWPFGKLADNEVQDAAF